MFIRKHKLMLLFDSIAVQTMELVSDMNIVSVNYRELLYGT